MSNLVIRCRFCNENIFLYVAVLDDSALCPYCGTAMFDRYKPICQHPENLAVQRRLDEDNSRTSQRS